MSTRLTAVVAALAIAIVGCGGPAVRPGSSSRAPSPTAQLTPPSSPSSSLAVSPGPSASTALPTPAVTVRVVTPPVILAPGSRAVTISDRLRVRSKPGVTSDSMLYEPLLPLGTRLRIAEGPTYASDYWWYRVDDISVPLRGGAVTGWVASADHDGRAWIGPEPVKVAPRTPQPTIPPRPANDDPPGTLIATLPYTAAIDTTRAVIHAMEESSYCGFSSQSVWYRVTPSVDQTLVADTFGSNYDTILDVWEGSLSSDMADPGFEALTPIACDDDSGESPQSQVIFAAEAGRSYVIRVSAALHDPGGVLVFHLAAD